MQNMSVCAQLAREGRRLVIGCCSNCQGHTCKVRCIQDSPGVVSQRRAPVDGAAGVAQSSGGWHPGRPTPGESPALVLPSHRWRPSAPFLLPFSSPNPTVCPLPSPFRRSQCVN